MYVQIANLCWLIDELYLLNVSSSRPQCCHYHLHLSRSLAWEAIAIFNSRIMYKYSLRGAYFSRQTCAPNCSCLS